MAEPQGGPIDFDARYQALRRRFLDRCETDLPELEAAALEPETADRAALRERLHKLAGAAGTFGFPELSRIAGETDDALMSEWASYDKELAELVEAVRRTLAENA